MLARLQSVPVKKPTRSTPSLKKVELSLIHICTVIYGAEGFKCHSKICQLTYHDQGRIERITLLGTGNFLSLIHI